MRHVIEIKGQIITLTYEDSPEEIDVDELTGINYANLYGEAVTVSTALNRMGMLKAEAEKAYKLAKINAEIYEAELKQELRKEANRSGGKFMVDNVDGSKTPVKLTEGSLSDAISSNKKLQERKRKVIDAERDLGYMDSIFWAVQSKDRKLNNFLSAVTPEDFASELMEGTVNGIIIKKPKYLKRRG
jgi:predicted Rdx family selenoprotein